MTQPSPTLSIHPHVRDAFVLALARRRAQQLTVTSRQSMPDSDLRFTRHDGSPYQPLGDAQQNFLASRARITAFVGGRGSGKTAAGIQKAAPRIWRGLDGAIVGPNVPHFTLSTWPEAERWLPEKLIRSHNKQQKRITFNTGANVWYGGVDDPDAWRGPNLNWVWFDEAARKQTREAFDVLLATCRIGPEPQLWITSTPRGTGHWLHDVLFGQRFADDPETAERLLAELLSALGDRPLVEHFRGSIHENAANLDPAYYASLKATYSGLMAQQELEGEFVGLEGIVFDNWSPENIDPTAEYNPSLPLEWWVDDGYANGGGRGTSSYHPRVVLFAQQQADGAFVIVGECYQTQALAERTVADCLGVRSEAFSNGKGLKQLQASDMLDAGTRPPGLNVGLGWPFKAPDIAYVDSSAVELKARIWELDIQTVGATHAIEEGIKNLRAWIQDGNGKAMLRVNPRCVNLVREIQGLHYAEGDRATARAGTGQPKPVKMDDHGVDAVRYGLWTRRYHG